MIRDFAARGRKRGSRRPALCWPRRAGEGVLVNQHLGEAEKLLIYGG
jgi:hypothetical protein